MSRAPFVLILDDDEGLATLIRKALEREGLRAFCVYSAKQATEWLNFNAADLLLIDLKLRDSDGRQVVESLRSSGKLPPFIVITGQGDERMAVQLMKSGARDYVVKDADFLELVPEVVRRALDQIAGEKRLAQAEEQIQLIQSIVEHGFSAVLITDADLPDPKVVYINPAFAQATGYNRETTVGERLSRIPVLEVVRRQLATGAPPGQLFLEQISMFTANGEEHWGEWRMGPVQGKTGKITNWLIIFREITEKKRLEKELLEISDWERQRLGQDLHDGLCQHLAAIELMCQLLEQKLQSRQKTAAARVGEIGKHVREAISQTRGLARGLSPLTLESEGLASALHQLSCTTESLFGVQCRFEGDPTVSFHNRAALIHLYRIAQEAISNAIKHGKATEISIALLRNSNHLVLSVEDNGIGFPVAIPSRGGLGLRIMQYRAGMISAALSFGKSSRGGAAITCSVPL